MTFSINLALAVCLLVPALAWAQHDPSLSIELKDEGVSQGRVKILDCVGSAITCTKSGTTGTISASGGAGSANTVAVLVDFGADGAADASAVVTGQAWVTTSSVIACSPTLVATADRIEGAEDAVIEGLVGAVHTRVLGTGFTLTAAPRVGLAIGKTTFHCTGA